MTDLLQQAIEQIERLPAETQDALAVRLLADLEDEQAWTASFAGTSAEQWDRLADLAQREIGAGEITPLEEVFPGKVTGE